MSVQYTQNQTYGSALKSASSLAGTLKNIRTKVPVKTISQNYGNLTNAIRGQQPGTGTALEKLKNLGPTTTQYGGKTRYESFHPGVDVAAPEGTNIPAFTGGKVTESVTGMKQGDKGYGNYVVVTDSNGMKVRYSHLNQTYVPVGATVTTGQNIGTEGNTGSTYSNTGGSGAHLDLRIQDAYGRYVNPSIYLGYAK